MAKAAPVIEDDQTNATVDTEGEVDEFRSGRVSEAELDVARSLAKRMGVWKPREEWTGAEADWRDAPEVLEGTAEKVAGLLEKNRQLKERLYRQTQAQAAALEDVRRAAEEQARADVRAAAQAGDPEAAEAATKRLEAAKGPPPEVAAWIGKNPWFTEDQEAADYARSITARLANRPLAEQLEAVDQAVRKRFPEHFGGAAEDRTEARLSEVRRPAPPVQSGTRGNGGVPKDRGWGDLPQAARTAATKFVRAYQSRGLSEADAQKRYATSYWSDQA